VPKVVNTLARMLALVALVVVAVGGTRGSGVDAAQVAALEAPALAVLGDTIVVCGREVFADLIDTSWLVLPERQCTDLFADLFAREVCAFDDPDCDRAVPAAPAPAPLQLHVSSSPTPTLPTRADAIVDASRRAWPPRVDDEVPTGAVISPLERPPRDALA
jgi:hypothetical protein